MDRELGVRIYALAIVLLVITVASGCAGTGEPAIHQPINELRGYVSLPPGYVSEVSASPQYRYEVGLYPTSLPDARPLAQAASRAGAVVVSGFDLLLHQAARQVELMTGVKPAPLEAMRAAGQAELARRAAAR